jgi:hypothetical protein
VGTTSFTRRPVGDFRFMISKWASGPVDGREIRRWQFAGKKAETVPQ